MDLKAYYRKLRAIEKGIVEPFVLVKSLATADGGVAGRLTEVAREVAARMLAEGLAELAAQSEVEAFRRQLAEEKKREDQKRASSQLQFTVLTEADLRAIQRGGRASSKE